MSIKADRGTPFFKTATNSTSAVATQTGVANRTSYITDISGSSDKAGSKILVKDGTTVIWQDNILVSAAGACFYEHSFVMPISATVGADISVTVDGTSICNANMAGFVINNS